MELSWLEDFLSLASSGNFSISAAQRNMTQSAFSKRIKALENWIGADLIDRRTFPAELTPAGQEFREVAQTTLNLIHVQRNHFRSSFHSKKVDLRILCAITLALRFTPRWILDLQSKVGKFSTSLKTQNFYTMVQSLNDRETDFVLQYSHPTLPSLYQKTNIQSLVLTNEALIPVSTVVDGRLVFNLDEMPIENIPLLRYSKNGFLARAEDIILKRNGVPEESTIRVIESPISEVLKKFALLGEGVTWLPASCIESELKSGELRVAGGESWQEVLEVRLYMLKDSDNRLATLIWNHLSG